jgi:hypothetical protein
LWLGSRVRVGVWVGLGVGSGEGSGFGLGLSEDTVTALAPGAPGATSRTSVACSTASERWPAAYA